MSYLWKFLSTLYHELIGFLGIGPLLDMYHKNDYSSLHTLQGIENAIGPVIPFLLLLEILRAAFFRRFKVVDYKVQFFTYVFNQFAGRFIAIAATAFCIGVFQKYGLIKTSFTWYWLIYGYIAWELRISSIIIWRIK